VHDTGRMREAFAHTAVLDMAAGADERVPGAAITTVRCGDLEERDEDLTAARAANRELMTRLNTTA
jgi:hypothetical protein